MKNAIHLGDKVELVTEVTLNKHQDKYYSKVQEVNENDEVVILAPIESGRIEPLELNRKYGMCIYTDNGLYRCEVMVTKRIKSDNLYLITLEIQTTLQKYQRRQYFRMDCMLSFQYKDDIDTNWHEGIILDISGGGIRFTSHTKLENQKSLINHIQLEMFDVEEDLYLSGTIIESVIGELDKAVFENRVEFDYIDNHDREVIIKFIFEEERRRRRRRKGF